MTRIERKIRKDLYLKNEGGLPDLFDSVIKSIWRISDEEYDYILETATDYELDLLIQVISFQPIKFSEKRNSINSIDQILERYKKIKDDKSIFKAL